MTKHTDSSRSTDSGVSDNAQKEASEIRRLPEDAELFRSQMQKALGIVEDGRVWFGSGLIARAETLVIRESECSRLASRVEELEAREKFLEQELRDALSRAR